MSSSFIKSTKPFCINPQPSTLLCSNFSTPSLYQPQTPQPQVCINPKPHCPSTLPTPLSYALCVCVTWCVCVCVRARVCHSILNSTLPPSSHPTKVLVFATLDTTSVVAGTHAPCPPRRDLTTPRCSALQGGRPSEPCNEVPRPLLLR